MNNWEEGSYREQERFIVEWSKLGALSEEFADKMAGLASLGMESFNDVEVDFLTANPEAMDQDPSLAVFKGLKGNELTKSMNTKLHHFFHIRPSDLSDEKRSFVADAFYYVVTIKERSSDKILGFVTYLSGGPVPKDEYKIIVLAVDTSSRRIGLGGFLISFLEKMGIKSNKLFLCTRPSNSIAINAYKKWGFIEDDEAKKSAPPQFIQGHWIFLARFL